MLANDANVNYTTVINGESNRLNKKQNFNYSILKK
jgi:hypothetical protein